MAKQNGLTAFHRLLIVISIFYQEPSSGSVCSSSGIHFQSSIYSDRYLTTPNYPYNYLPSTTCLWSLSRPSTTYAVKLTFRSFFLESSSSCTHDYVEIRDGDALSRSTLIGKFCGTRLPPIIVSKYKYIFVKFVSDRDYIPSIRKFQATFRAFVPAVSLSGKCSINSPFLHNNNLQLSSSSGGIFRSPSYPSYYPSNMVCTWKITAPTGKKLKISFNYFRLESGVCSTNDYLEVRDGPYSTSLRKGTYCGSYAPSITSSGQYMWVRFRSDSQLNYKGFEARYTIVSVSVTSSKVGTVVGVIVAIVVIVAAIAVVIYFVKRKNRRVVRTQAVPIATTTTTVTTTQPHPAGYPQAIPQQYPPPGMQPGPVPPHGMQLGPPPPPGAMSPRVQGPPPLPGNGMSHAVPGMPINPGTEAYPQPLGVMPSAQAPPPYYPQ